MILDAIIGLFASLFGFLAEGIVTASMLLINLVAICLEMVVGIFVSGFSLGRVGRKKRESQSKASQVGGILTLLLVAGAVGWFIVVPKVMTRKLTFVADDGHILPFAAIIIHTNGRDKHERTDNAGNIVIPRFATDAITIKDPRYVERTWNKSEIGTQLVVGRTILGSGLDSIADRLLKPATK